MWMRTQQGELINMDQVFEISVIQEEDRWVLQARSVSGETMILASMVDQQEVATVKTHLRFLLAAKPIVSEEPEFAPAAAAH